MKILKSIAIAIISILSVTNISASDLSVEETAINLVVTEYLKLKDALVKSSPAEAAKAANAMQSALKKIQSADPETKKSIAGISAGLTDLSEASKLDGQRTHFKSISDNLHNLIEILKPSQILYRQYCPMAFGNKGGHWISAEKEVRNPYFGDAMLKCGKVVETIN